MTAQVIKGFVIVLVILTIGILGLKVLTPSKKTSDLITAPGMGVGQTSGSILSLSPASGTYSSGESFPVEVILDTKGEQVMGAEAVILFDPTMLSVSDDNITAGTIFPAYPMKRAVGGKLRIVGVISDPNQPQFTGKGTLGTIMFTALKKGAAALTIDFVEGATDKSNVLKLGDKESGINFLTKVENAKYTIK